MIDKETIYDNQIYPLMDRIIAICKEHDIPFVASYQLTDGLDADGSPRAEGVLCCTSAFFTNWCDADGRLMTMRNVALFGMETWARALVEAIATDLTLSHKAGRMASREH